MPLPPTSAGVNPISTQWFLTIEPLLIKAILAKLPAGSPEATFAALILHLLGADGPPAPVPASALAPGEKAAKAPAPPPEIPCVDPVAVSALHDSKAAEDCTIEDLTEWAKKNPAKTKAQIKTEADAKAKTDAEPAKVEVVPAAPAKV